jgi:hypothetical protein
LHKLIALIAALAMSAGFAACGGGDEEGGDSGETSSDANDFPTLADSICNEASGEVAQANLELGYSTEEADIIDLVEQSLAIRKDAVAQLEELEPPDEFADAFDRALAARHDLIDAIEDEVAARKKGDTAALEEIIASEFKAGDASDKASAEAGLSDCAGVLPDDDAQAAEDVLREYAVTADPETACSFEGDGLVSEPFLEEGFGGVEACTKAQEKLQDNPDDLATDIKVSKATGVDNVIANVEFEDVGGKFDKLSSVSTLYYVDGAWRLFSISEAG